jgi:hypothetical protein
MRDLRSEALGPLGKTWCQILRLFLSRSFELEETVTFDKGYKTTGKKK